MRTRYTTCLLLWIALALPVLASAQNLLANGDFDTNFSGWTQNGSGSASPDAAAGSPSTGSVSLTVNDPSGNGLTKAIQQCVVAVVGPNYTLTGRTLLGTLTGATAGDGMFIIVQFFPNLGCTGSPTSTIANPTGTASGQPSNFTTNGTGIIQAPVGAKSMKVTAQVQTGGGGAGTAQGWVDHIQLTSDLIFRNDFE